MSKIVFAYWEADGYYYPATAGDARDGFSEVSFMDGQSAEVKDDQLEGVAAAMENMGFQADWKKGGSYYDCRIVATSDDLTEFTVLYEDGTKEQVGLSQLRAHFAAGAETGKVQGMETGHEAKMASIYGRIKTTIIYLCIGWAFLMFFMINVQTMGSGVMFLSLLGMVIAPWPMLRRMLAGGFGAMFNMPEYVVVTTHGDGRKTSDHGAESAALNIVMKLLLLVIGVAIGTVATFVYLVFLTIRYIVLYVQANPKPAFMQSAFFLYAVLLLVVPGAVVAGVLTSGGMERAALSRARNENRAVYDAAANAHRQTATAYVIHEATAGRGTRAVTMTLIGPDGARTGSRSLANGAAVTITGPASPTRGQRSFNFRVPVEHEGSRGYVDIRRLGMSPPNP